MNAYRATAEITNIMASKDKSRMRAMKPLQYLGSLARAMGYLVSVCYNHGPMTIR